VLRRESDWYRFRAGFERLFDDESASPKSTRGGSRESCRVFEWEKCTDAVGVEIPVAGAGTNEA